MFTSSWNNFKGGLLWLILLRIYMSEWFSPLFHKYSWLFMFITYIQGNSWCNFTFMNMSWGRHFVFRSFAHYGFNPHGVLGASCMTSGLCHAPRSLCWWQCHWGWDIVPHSNLNLTHTRASKRKVLLEECLMEQCSSFKLVFKHISQPLLTGVDSQAWSTNGKNVILT